MATNSSINSTNPIQVARGGTNATTFATTDGTIYFDGTRLVTTATGTVNQVLISGGAGVAPAYGNGVLTINGDSGTATPAAGVVTLTGTATYAGKTVVFEGNTASVRLKTTDINNNTCIGIAAGSALSGGNSNTALGRSSLTAHDGSSATAVGFESLASATSAGSSVAFGYRSLNSVLTGQACTAIGTLSGSGYTTSESSNITIGYNVTGTAGESNVCRIGIATGTGSGQLNATFIHGIAGITVASTAAVLVNTSTGQLGTIISSRRFKINITDLGVKSSRILDLRPTSFVFKDKPEMGEQYGLIAEEVAEIMPELVVHDSQGSVASVKYHDLPILLLNEIQKMKKEIQSLRDKLGE